MNRQRPSTAAPSSSQASPYAALRRTSGRRPLLDDDKRRQWNPRFRWRPTASGVAGYVRSRRKAKVIQKLDGLRTHFSTPALSIDGNLHSEPRAQVLELPKLAAATLAEVNLNTTKAC